VQRKELSKSQKIIMHSANSNLEAEYNEDNELTLTIRAEEPTEEISETEESEDPPSNDNGNGGDNGDDSPPEQPSPPEEPEPPEQPNPPFGDTPGLPFG
jgi:hypothetical protein